MNKTMQEVLYENKMNIRRLNMEQKKKREKKERVLTIIIGTFIVMATLTIMVLSDNYTRNSINSCMQNHSYIECMSHA